MSQAKFEVLQIPVNLEGATLTDGTMLVNVEYIYHDICDRNEDSFIAEFGDVLTHELLHQEVRKIIRNPTKFAYGEEKVIRSMLNQPMNEKEKRFYNDTNKATTIPVRRIK